MGLALVISDERSSLVICLSYHYDQSSISRAQKQPVDYPLPTPQGQPRTLPEARGRG